MPGPNQPQVITTTPNDTYNRDYSPRGNNNIAANTADGRVSVARVQGTSHLQSGGPSEDSALVISSFDGGRPLSNQEAANLSMSMMQNARTSAAAGGVKPHSSAL